MALPSVFAYLDYRSFLRDWLDARKRADRTYSYAQFATDGRCSKSTLANVLSGARTPRTATLDAFARAISLDPSERNYLGLLVDLSSATEIDQRRVVMERIVSSERFKQVRLAEGESDSTVFRYVEHWYIPAVRELASLPAFRPDADWIATVMRPPITPEQAQDALDRLFELNFLSRSADGGIEVHEVQFRTEPVAEQAAIMHFHREQIPELLRHVSGEHVDEQHLIAGTIILPESLVPEVKARIASLVQQLAALGDSTPDKSGARVYQIAAQLLPLTEPID